MSRSPAHRAVRIGLLLTGTVVGTGCGATGLDWVAESESSPRVSEHEYPATQAAARPESGAVTALAEEEPSPAAPPRLSRTVTLGEINVAPPASGPVPVTGSGVSVTINNYTSVSAPGVGYGYAGFGFGRSAGFSSRGPAASASRSSGAGPQAGQNWPTIADHGSSFPYRSAPASPWARTQ